jgi:hypothetical protein
VKFIWEIWAYTHCHNSTTEKPAIIENSKKRKQGDFLFAGAFSPDAARRGG